MAEEMNELQRKLSRRNLINEGESPGKSPDRQVFNPYTEFPEFTRKQIKEFQATFKKYNTSRDGFLDLLELKIMMEKLGSPQTHIGLKAMIKEVDDDNDGQMSFKEFLMIYKKAAAGTLQSVGLTAIANSVDVTEVGVSGAKNFFQAKADELTRADKGLQEIKDEQEARKREAAEAVERKRLFKEKMSHLN